MQNLKFYNISDDNNSNDSKHPPSHGEREMCRQPLRGYLPGASVGQMLIAPCLQTSSMGDGILHAAPPVDCPVLVPLISCHLIFCVAMPWYHQTRWHDHVRQAQGLVVICQRAKVGGSHQIDVSFGRAPLKLPQKTGT